MPSCVCSTNRPTRNPTNQKIHSNRFVQRLDWVGAHHTFSACVTVRGNPSSKNPFRHSGLSKLLSIMSTTKSSDTNLPASMMRLSSAPIFEPAAISARNISPVDKWHTQNFSFSSGAYKSHAQWLHKYYNDHRANVPCLCPLAAARRSEEHSIDARRWNFLRVLLWQRSVRWHFLFVQVHSAQLNTQNRRT